jgi:hypothetical protein
MVSIAISPSQVILTSYNSGGLTGFLNYSALSKRAEREPKEFFCFSFLAALLASFELINFLATPCRHFEHVGWMVTAPFANQGNLK